MKLQAIVMFLMVITIVSSSCAGICLEPTAACRYPRVYSWVNVIS